MPQSAFPTSSGSRAMSMASPRFVLREHLGLPRLGLVLSRVEVGERLPVGVADDIAAGDLVGAPGRREAA
jgi:hypothetical protein